MSSIFQSKKFGRYILLSLFLLAVLVWVAVFQTPNSNLHLFFFDVGQGDAIFIQRKNFQILIDGGPDTKVLSRLGRVMPFYDRKIEYVILTHPHSDHIVGLIEVLKRYQVGQVLATDAPHTTGEYLEFLKLIKEKNLSFDLAIKGKKIETAQISLEILHPDKSFKQVQIDNLNNTSVVSRLSFLNFSAILTGDAEKIILDKLSNEMPDKLSANVLKISHHGSEDGLDSLFLKKVSPELAIISVGKDNQFGHPSIKTLKLLEHIKTFRTDQNGTVEIETNGHNFWIKKER